MLPLVLAIIAFIGGVILLYKASDILVDGTSKTAAQLGVSSLIISMIVVAFGTSTPELAISVGAALQSHEAISMGNIIGSCIANLLLVLGISAIIKPIKVKKSIIRREMPIVIVVTVIFFLFSYLGLLDSPNNTIGGIIFIIFFVVFVYYFIRCANKEKNNNNVKYDIDKTSRNIILIILSIIGVVLGAWLLIESALTFATILGIPEIIIALSMVAVGTSLPELVVSSMAAYKNKSDIAVGNVLGSNVFNIFLVLGVSGIFISLNAKNNLGHILFLFIITLVMTPILYTKHKISRIEGLAMLIIYFIFIWYIFFGFSFFE
jgi:cation:H+ antiporter